MVSLHGSTTKVSLISLYNMKNTIKWNEETINAFNFISCYLTKEKTIEKIKLFVEVDCIPEGDESEEDLVEDLVKRIFPCENEQ